MSEKDIEMSDNKIEDLSDVAIKIENVGKKYRLGAIGGQTLRAELQSKWARFRKKEDPNSMIGSSSVNVGEVFWALDGIDLTVKKGEAVGIIGSNGAGKSTLLKLLSRVTAPTTGEIKIDGRIASMLEVGTGFHPELTGRENIYMNGAILGMTKKEVDSKIEEIIDFSECRQFIDTPVKRYSSGMYVKLAFAVAAHLDAEIMIMDEVLAVGDVKFQKKCLGKMGDAANNEGKTVLYVSHNMSTIRQLCTRCVVLNHGKVVFDGDVEDAIAVYTEQEKGELDVFHDFTEVRRPSPDHGRDFFIHNLRFINKTISSFERNEKIRFELEMSSKRDFENLGIYYTVLCEDGGIVGTTQCDDLGSFKSGERKKCVVEMDASNIVAGTYYFFVDVFYKNEYNTFLSVDHPNKRIFFKLQDEKNDNGILWNKQYFGSVRLNDLKITEIEKL